LKVAEKPGFVSGHDFSRAVSETKLEGFSPWVFPRIALKVAEKPGFVSGHDFSRAVSETKLEGFSPWVFPRIALKVAENRVLYQGTTLVGP
jgi:hypothetical protein